MNRLQKRFFVLDICIAGLLCSCATQPSDGVQTDSYGTHWKWRKDTIVVETPERPTGQKSVIGMAVPAMEIVRVGFVGLGVHGVDAVKRFTCIPGVRIVALCDYGQERADSCLKYLQDASMPRAAVYFGAKSYERLCKRDDIDLVYVSADWLHHFPVLMGALENGKNVAFEPSSHISLKECWNLIDVSEKTRRHCIPLDSCHCGRAEVNNRQASRLVYCLRNGLPPDMNVYHLAERFCLVELKKLSMDNNSAPVTVPDFTRGEWGRFKRCKHAYAAPEEEAASMEKAKAFTVKLKEQGTREWAAE
nr:Gfo/Idh/MocA family oxidoreductase [uncultured Bacteroides sp.]